MSRLAPLGRTGTALLIGIMSVAVMAGPTQAQTLGGGGVETGISWWRLGAALALCLCLAVGGAFALRSRLRGAMPIFGNEKRKMQLVETLRLSHQVDVCLFTCEDVNYMVATFPQGAVVISKEPSEPGSRLK